MTDHRKLMTEALKQVFVPALRQRGFKGSFPHFHRVGKAGVDYLTVQFNSAGGSFVAEIAACDPGGKPTGYGSELPVSKLNVQYFNRRYRLGADNDIGHSDHWFVFGPRNYDAPQPPLARAHYEGVAQLVVTHLDTQAEAWWAAC